MGQTYSVPLICLLSHSSSSTIEIQNAGFESDVVGHDNTFLYGSNLLQPWERYDPMGIMTERSTGVMNPTGGTSFNDLTYGDSAPEGTQDGYLEMDDVKGEFGIVQTLTGNTVTAGTTYTLSAWVGNSVNNTWSIFSTEASGTYDMSQFPVYRLQILADINVLIESSDQLVVEDGQWEQTTISIAIPPGDPHIGQTLAIRLLINRKLDYGIGATGPGPQQLCCFDGVRLEATTMAPSVSPTMEPTTEPTVEPTYNPSEDPSSAPSESPSRNPTNQSEAPSESPTAEPTVEPTGDPSNAPSKTPSVMPTASPTDHPVADDETTKPGDDDDSDASYITFAANMIIGICLSLAMM